MHFTDSNMAIGKDAPVCLADCRSWKLKRVCRSSLAAETQSRSEALDALEFAMLFEQELKEPAGVDEENVDDVLALRPGFLVTDFKRLYDALERIETKVALTCLRNGHRLMSWPVVKEFATWV